MYSTLQDPRLKVDASRSQDFRTRLRTIDCQPDVLFSCITQDSMQRRQSELTASAYNVPVVLQIPYF